MSGSGKTSTSTSQVQVPADVLARYNSVNQTAQQVAQTPFQQYSTNPDAFVAPINQEQTAGINATNAAANEAQPYIGAATGYTLAGGQAVNPTQLTGNDINQYLSPYLGDVAESTEQLLNQSNQQQQGGQLGDAITSGAFGGDRAGIAAANLEQQQNLGNASILSGILNTGYNTALSTAQQQQGVDLSAAQANRVATQQTGASLADLGTAGQTAALQGAQAQQAAGATQQQTTQAGDTALYNQFLQQQSYPFQTAQFLANIAEGTGALSGSTTTTTQPQSIFSDERLKENINVIGKTFGGQNVVAFRYKGDPTRRIGLIAQDVEKKHPEAVKEVGGFKAVDYGKATDADAERGHFRRGGLVPANDDRGHFAYGGSSLDPSELAMLESAGTGTYGPYAQGGLYGSSASGAPRGYVPAATLPVGHLAVAQAAPPPPSMLAQATQMANLGTNIYKGVESKPAQSAIKTLGSFFQSPADQVASDTSGRESEMYDTADMAPLFKRGGRIARDLGGGVDDPYEVAGSGGLNIPDDKPQDLSLATAKPPSSSDNGLGDLAQIAGDVLKFIPMASGGAIQNDLAGLQDPAEANTQAMLKSLLSDKPRNEDDDASDDDTSVDAPPGAPDPAAGSAGSLGAAYVSEAAKSAPQAAAGAPASGSLPTDLANTLKLISRAEGTGQNPKSSAHGLYQIVDPTFVSLYRQMFPSQASGMSRGDILALRATPEGDKLSAQMGPYLAQQNIGKLQAAGIDPTPPNVYLAHFLGPAGAMKVLGADPSTPMEQLEPPLAIAENKSIMKGKTAGDVINWAGRRLQQVNYARGGKVRRGYADGGQPTDAPDPTAPDADVDAVGNASGVPLGETTPQPLVHDPAATPAPPKSSWQDNLKKPEVFIPLLTGLAAAASTPTVHPLMAIAEGLGAGAQSYQQQRAFQLEQQKTAQHGQEVGVLQSEQALEPQKIAIDRNLAAAHAAQAKVAAYSTLLANIGSLYKPVSQVGPDGLPGFKGPNGDFISATDYGKVRASYMNAVSGVAGLPSIPGVTDVSPSSGGSVQPANGGTGVPPAGSGVSGSGAVPSGSVVPPASGGAVGAAVGRPSAGPAGNGTGARPPHASLAQRVQAGAYRASPVALPQPSATDVAKLKQIDNPDWLQQQGQALINMGSPEQASQGQSYLAHRQDILAGKVTPQMQDGTPYNGYARYNQALGNQSTIESTYAQQKATKNAASSEFSGNVPQAYQVQSALNKIYGETNTNRLTPEIADLVGKASTIPGLRELIAPAWQQYQSTNDEAVKETALQTMVQAAATHLGQGAPASTLSEASHTVPLPTMAPGARYDLAAQQLALLKQKQDYYRDWNANKDQVDDVSSYDNDWVAAHPVSTYQQWAYDHIAPFAGMTDQQKLAHPRKVGSPTDVQKLPPHTPFVIPSGPNQGKIGWSS